MFDIKKIFNWLKKSFALKDILILVSIVFIFFITRLTNLDKFPIFGDEGIYIHWAKTAWYDAGWRFVSLTDGKQPLQTWGIIPFLKIFPDNPLLAGRLFSVTTGFIALSGMFSLLFYLFGKRTAFLGTLIYILTPYFIFYDRMALSDSAVNAGFIWILFFSILLIKTLRLDVALLFGMISGVTLLTKSSARLFVGLSFLAPILVFEKNLKKFIIKLINFFILFSLAVFMALIIYNIQRLSPFFHFVAEKNKTFVMTFSEFLTMPYAYVKGNLPLIIYYVLSEAGLLLTLGGFLGLIVLLRYDIKLGGYLLSWLLIPYIIIAFFSKVLYPRYLIFFASLLIIGFSFILSRLKKTVGFIIVMITIATVIYYNYTIIFDHQKIPFPEIDRGQYITGVTAGWGVKEIIEFAREKSKNKKVILLAEGNFGVIGDQLEVFIKKDDNIQIKGYWPLDEKNLLENQKELGKNYVYVVFSHRQEFPQNWPITLIKKYEKPERKSFISLFELTK